MFNYVEVRINKSETTHVTVRVPSWEVPVLAQVHGEDRVIPTGNVFPVSKQKPAARAEYDRMALKYKNNREQGGAEYVASVYGAGDIGVRTLEREMAREPESETGDFGLEVHDAPVEDDPTAGLFDDPPVSAGGAQPITE